MMSGGSYFPQEPGGADNKYIVSLYSCELCIIPCNYLQRPAAIMERLYSIVTNVGNSILGLLFLSNTPFHC